MNRFYPWGGHTRGGGLLYPPRFPFPIAGLVLLYDDKIPTKSVPVELRRFFWSTVHLSGDSPLIIESLGMGAGDELHRILVYTYINIYKLCTYNPSINRHNTEWTLFWFCYLETFLPFSNQLSVLTRSCLNYHLTTTYILFLFHFQVMSKHAMFLLSPDSIRKM